MKRIELLDSKAGLERLVDVPGLPSLTRAQLEIEKPDETWLLSDSENNVAARLSLWWNSLPELEGERIGVLGHYAAGDRESGGKLIAHAFERLLEQGCSRAVGPMDGNTWHHYRFVTEWGTEPPFFMEPENPGDWPDHFLSVGFEPLATYFSSIAEDLTKTDPRVNRVSERLGREGVTIRSLSMESFSEELERIYEVSVDSFKQNYLYTPIGKDDFLSQYEPIRDYINCDLVLLAELNRRPVGYVFCIPDYSQSKRGEEIDTLIVKTIAILPERRLAGLGALLLARIHKTAGDHGFKKVIHALMHEDNNSLQLSGRYARPFRRYTLYSKVLKT